MNKKMGRPKLRKGEARGKFISTRLSPPEYAEIKSAIRDSGNAKTAWIREALLKVARQR